MQEKSRPGAHLFPQKTSLMQTAAPNQKGAFSMKTNTSLVLDTLFRLVLLVGYAFIMVQIGGFHLSLIVILSVLCIIAAQGISDLITNLHSDNKAHSKA